MEVVADDVFESPENVTIGYPILTDKDFIAIVGMKNNIPGIKVIDDWYQFCFDPGGVICFWGGIVLLGFLFMFVLMAKNYLIRKLSSRKFDE